MLVKDGLDHYCPGTSLVKKPNFLKILLVFVSSEQILVLVWATLLTEAAEVIIGMLHDVYSLVRAVRDHDQVMTTRC